MLDSELAYFRSAINREFGQELQEGEGLPEHAIEALVRQGPFPLDEPSLIWLIRELEASFTVSQRRGAVISKGYRPWLTARRTASDFDGYYWNRLKKYYLETGVLPSHVLATLDSDTDEILDRCGNPKQSEDAAVRGMVMGSVQSGKTTNYSALICKAADAGYKVIILLAGITNSLRSQTQERLDDTFIGKVSVFGAAAQQSLPIQNYAAKRRIPAFGTTRDSDFSAGRDGIYFGLAGHSEPMIFVTKKNKSVLERLERWIDEQRDTGGYDLPLLLIDDEADNASINTAKDPARTTAINGVIRNILSRFPRSAYIGYTATPFANIFIDPETNEEMETDDLFPGNFIKALDPPTNYVGSRRVFHPNGSLRAKMVRPVDDYRAVLPLKHKSDAVVVELPESLREAIRVYCLTRAIRVLDGKGATHCSMMINVSRFNAIQNQVLGLVYEYLSEMKEAVAVHGALPWNQITDEEMQAIHDTFETEFSALGRDWTDVLASLNEGIQSIDVRTVNMQGGKLDYRNHRDQGLHVIAIGGLALSRGLTLEGLTVSYLLRNTAASDTLMQMARWFGYRPGYEDICRLYLPQMSLDHYEYVDEASEELRNEIKRMQAANRTPADFGLKVRQSPLALSVTASNKMRTAQKLTIAQDYSARHVEGHALANDPLTAEANWSATTRFIENMGNPTKIRDGYALWQQVPGADLLKLLRTFQFGEHPDLAVISDHSLFFDYAQDRIRGELKYWDVALPMKRKGDGVQIAGLEVRLRKRIQGTVLKGTYRVNGARNRVADPTDAWIGLTNTQKQDADEAVECDEYRKERAACSVREQPLMLIHMFTAQLRQNAAESDDVLRLESPVCTLSFCMPETSEPSNARTYQVNTVYRRQLERFEDEQDDDEEMMLGDNDAG